MYEDTNTFQRKTQSFNSSKDVDRTKTDLSCIGSLTATEVARFQSARSASLHIGRGVKYRTVISLTDNGLPLSTHPPPAEETRPISDLGKTGGDIGTPPVTILGDCCMSNDSPSSEEFRGGPCWSCSVCDRNAWNCTCVSGDERQDCTCSGAISWNTKCVCQNSCADSLSSSSGIDDVTTSVSPDLTGNQIFPANLHRLVVTDNFHHSPSHGGAFLLLDENETSGRKLIFENGGHERSSGLYFKMATFSNGHHQHSNGNGSYCFEPDSFNPEFSPDPSEEDNTPIFSSKGTVRGVRNRVKNKIAVFIDRQHGVSSVKVIYRFYIEIVQFSLLLIFQINLRVGLRVPIYFG